MGSTSVLLFLLIAISAVACQRHGQVQDTTIGNVPDGIAPLGVITFQAVSVGRYFMHSINISQDGWYPDERVGYELAIISLGMFIGSELVPTVDQPIEIGIYANCVDNAGRDKPCQAPLSVRRPANGLSEDLNILNNYNLLIEHNQLIWIFISLPANTELVLYSTEGQLNERSSLGAVTAFATTPLANNITMQNVANAYVNFDGPVAQPPYDAAAIAMWVTVQQRRIGHLATGTGNSAIATLGGAFANITNIGPPSSTTTSTMSTTTTTTTTTAGLPPLPSSSPFPTGSPSSTGLPSPSLSSSPTSTLCSSKSCRGRPPKTSSASGLSAVLVLLVAAAGLVV